MSFAEELKRRKVFRVAGAYLVGAWIVLQVATTLLPALDLPSWTVKAIAIAAIIGFPISLVLGWLFDITPGGVERTSASEGFHFPARAAIAGTLIVLVGVTGFLFVRRRLSAAGIDQNAVVVIPFRVSGNEKLASMREGMVDLMSPKLTGQGGPRAVDSRTALSAWRRAVRSEKDDMEPREAIKLARKLGAGHVILGEVIGAADEIALNARVYSTIDGVASDPAHVRAKPDSVLNAVDALVTELLSRKAGEKDRLAMLMTESLPAVQAYLDGQRTYRLGKYNDAAKHYATALDIDSTFALAAWGEIMSRGWAGYGPRYGRAITLAFAFRDRLPPREKAMLNGWFGENYPKSSTRREMITRMEEVTARYPDSPDALYELGDAYYHHGEPLGLEDYDDRALTAWNRAIALDSSFAGPWEHQLEIHATRGDTANVRKVFAKLKELKADRAETAAGWLYAAATNDDTMRTRLLKAMPKWTRGAVSNSILAISNAGVSPDGVDELANRLYNDSTLAEEARSGAKYNAATFALERGRPNQAFKYLREALAIHHEEWWHKGALIDFGIMYPEVFADSAERVIKERRSGKNPWDACRSALWDGLNGRVAETRQSIQVATDSIPKMNEWLTFHLKYCTQMARAALAVTTDPAHAAAEVQRADSFFTHGPMLASYDANYGAVLLARLYTRIGDSERARAAAQRGANAIQYKMPQMLELARASARTGRREQAIRSYRIYLSFQDPEPGRATEMRDKVRAELAALVSQ